MTSDRQLLSVDEAATKAGVSRRTIYNWMASGKVSFIRTAGGQRRMLAESLFHETGTSFTTVSEIANSAPSVFPDLSAFGKATEMVANYTSMPRFPRLGDKVIIEIDNIQGHGMHHRSR